MRLDMRIDCRAKLERLADDFGKQSGGPRLSLIATIEKLILDAPEPERLPRLPTEFVRDRLENGGGMG
jgi:hypothetical protein